MNATEVRRYLRKGWPCLIAVLAVAILVQGWFLVRMHGLLAERPAADESVVRLTPDRPRDLWRDPLGGWGSDPNAWNPFAEMEAMRERMNGVFGDAFGPFPELPGLGSLLDAGAAAPEIDLRDEGDRFVLDVDLPDAENRRVNVSCENQAVTISGTLEEATEAREGDSMFRSGRRSRRFSKTIALGVPVQAEKMKTEFGEDSVRVVIPKA